MTQIANSNDISRKRVKTFCTKVSAGRVAGLMSSMVPFMVKVTLVAEDTTGDLLGHTVFTKDSSVLNSYASMAVFFLF